MFKYITDKNYKDVFNNVKIPLHLVRDKRYSKVLETFLRDEDYRKRLSITIQHSFVYKNKRRVGGHFDTLTKHRVETAEKNIINLSDKLSSLDEELKTLSVVLKYVK